MNMISKIKVVGMLLGSLHLAFGQKGVVIVPVADLVGAPILKHTSYENLEWSCRLTDYEASPRLHQLLFNEIVEIREVRGDEIRVEIPQIYYISARCTKPQNSYWTHKKNILPLKLLSPTQAALIPSPIKFSRKNNYKAYYNTIALIKPIKDPKSGMVFSAGTRFIKTPAQSHDSHYSVYCLRRQSTENVLTIARKDCYEYKPKSRAQIIKDYVAILKVWANCSNGFIPYVLGGSSYTQNHTKNQFVLDKATFNNKTLHFYRRPYYKEVVKTGFDCSGIIARAAQIVGIPYHLKNTYTLRKNLKSVEPNGEVCNGDIIWFDGHVLVIVDAKNNIVVEANSYDGKYGIIHQKPLGLVFKKIKSIADLQKIRQMGQSLERLNADQVVIQKYKIFEILKIESAWDLVAK